jgi:stage II sporulation protein D
LSANKLIYELNGAKAEADMIRLDAEKISIKAYPAEERFYAGSIEIYPEKEELLVVNETSEELYVHAAALAESGALLAKDPSAAAGWEKEYLSSMEICIRSYIAANGRRHTDPRYSFCDLTHCVHFTGMGDGSTAVSENAIMCEAGKKPLNAFFHSTCGGNLTNPPVYWPGFSSKCYRSGKDSVNGEILCHASPHLKWKSFVPQKAMNDICTFNVVELQLQLKQERVSALTVTSGTSEKTISASVFLSAAGRRLGWNVIKSNDFIVTKTAGGFMFEGKGLGHGIGLCQYGAVSLAKKGWPSAKILQFYYPGSILRPER